MNYTTKKEILKMKNDFVKNFNIIDLKKSISYNTYTCQTSIGKAEVSFDINSKIPCIFVRFHDVTKANKNIINKDRLNEFSGKYNFMGYCNSFVEEFYKFKI